MQDKYYIINPERTVNDYAPVFWKQGQYGYTSDINEAGHFSKDNAESICNRPYVKDYYIPVEE